MVLPDMNKFENEYCDTTAELMLFDFTPYEHQ